MVEKFKAENSTQLIACQTQLNNKETALNLLKLDNEAASNEKLALERKLNSQKLTIEQLQSQIHSRESENRRLENSNEQCENDLQDQKTSLESALNEKRRIESQFNQQQLTINQLESEKDAAESQSSYCNRQLSGKRSEISSLESENGRLENAEERCKNDLRDQKTSFTSIEGRFNLLIDTSSSIRIKLISGRTDSEKAWRDTNLSGSYHFTGIHNERPVFKRDAKDSHGKEVYLYYHTRVSRYGWYLATGTSFLEKSNKSYLSFWSSERDIRKISGTWQEYDGKEWGPIAKVTIT